MLFKNLVYDRFGIDLGFHKKSLVMGRLNKILRQRGINDFKTYYRFLKNDRSGDAVNEFIKNDFPSIELVENSPRMRCLPK